jgi:hypothetical protein
MRVSFEPDEAWELMSLVVNRLASEAALPAGDRAKIRRWRSEVMRPGSEAMRALTEKMNGDLAEALERKKRSQVRRPDWR